jgi:hypothetical protein
MKKIILLFVIVSMSVQNLQAQAKWRKEMLLQIAALQVYIDYAKKGYNVVKKGLNFIGELKKGEVHLHNDYFISLLKVNPKIKKYTRVGEIVLLQLKIIRISNNTFKELRHDDIFKGDEIDYIERAFDRLFENCNKTLDELLLVTKDGIIEMTDAQRVKRIDALYLTMSSDYEFCVSFSNEAKMLYLSRDSEKKNNAARLTLNGL